MKYLIVSFLLLSCAEPPKCYRFKSGTFSFELLQNGESQHTTFTRNDTIEISTFRGVTDTASIQWISDCEYILRKKHPKNLSERKAVQIKILSTEENGYHFEYSLVGDIKNTRRGFAEKIND